MSDIGKVVRRGKPEDRVLLGLQKPPAPMAFCGWCRRRVRVFKRVADDYYFDDAWCCSSCGRKV